MDCLVVDYSGECMSLCVLIRVVAAHRNLTIIIRGEEISQMVVSELESTGIEATM